MSSWLKRVVEQSYLKSSVDVVPNGVDTSKFVYTEGISGSALGSVKRN